MSRKLSFAQAIQYMTENPGKEAQSCNGYFYYMLDDKFVYFSKNKELASPATFTPYLISGQWTISGEKPEPEEVEVVAYECEEGQLFLYKKDSQDHEDAENDKCLTRCKIKFNQGESL